MDNVNTEGLANEEVSQVENQEVTQPSNDGTPYTWDDLVQSDPAYMQQFKSLADMKEKYKMLHNQYSGTVRDYKEQARAKEAEQLKAQEQEQVLQRQAETISNLVPQFLENNMSLTDEMMAVAKEVGLSEADIKLGAYELRDAINSAHELVGGREEYEAMINWAVGENGIDQAMRDQFDKDVVGMFSDNAKLKQTSKLSILGLHSLYEKNKGNTPPQTQQQSQERIVGTSNVGSTVKPYTDRNELLRDRSLYNGGKARDMEFRSIHERRLAVTPDSIWK